MSERWWRRRRRLDPWFGYFSDEADKMEKTIDEMIRQAFGSPVEREKARRRYLAQFGSLQPGYSRGSQTGEEEEPLLDMFVDDSSVIIVAELPGINKESIEVDATEDLVTISVDSAKRKHFREIKLPSKVDPKSSVASYRNGVLEVRLKKVLGERLIIK